MLVCYVEDILRYKRISRTLLWERGYFFSFSGCLGEKELTKGNFNRQ